MLRSALALTLGAVVAVALMVFAVLLWQRTLIIFAAPLGVASLATVWVTIDNQFLYRSKGTAPPEQ